MSYLVLFSMFLKDLLETMKQFKRGLKTELRNHDSTKIKNKMNYLESFKRIPIILLTLFPTIQLLPIFPTMKNYIVLILITKGESYISNIYKFEIEVIKILGMTCHFSSDHLFSIKYFSAK